MEALATSHPPPPNTSTWYNPGPLEFYSKVFDETNPSEIFGERYTYAQVVWIEYSLIGSLLGISAATIKEVLTNPNTTGSVEQLKNIKVGGVIGKSSNLISQAVSSPPASFKYWLSTRLEKFSIVPVAHAQSTGTTGFGYDSLKMFLPLWTASRNIAFAIMVIIVIMIAFGIMFRVKISPQLVVSIQSSLPKIASALILITFSYAIVGLLIDFMYLLFGALLYGLDAAKGLPAGLKVDDLFNDFLNGSVFNKVFSSYGAAVGTGGSVGTFVVLLLTAVLGWNVGLPALPFILGLIVAIFIYFFKTFIMLAQTYLSLVMNLVFAPIIILSEAIPFVKANALGWFRSVVADLLVFLAVGLLFLVQSLVNGIFAQASSGWGPPYLSYSSGIFRLMVWIGTWSLLPNIRNLVYSMLEKKPVEIQTPREFGHLGENASRLGQSLFGPGGKYSNT